MAELKVNVDVQGYEGLNQLGATMRMIDNIADGNKLYFATQESRKAFLGLIDEAQRLETQLSKTTDWKAASDILTKLKNVRKEVSEYTEAAVYGGKVVGTSFANGVAKATEQLQHQRQMIATTKNAIDELKKSIEAMRKSGDKDGARNGEVQLNNLKSQLADWENKAKSSEITLKSLQAAQVTFGASAVRTGGSLDEFIRRLQRVPTVGQQATMSLRNLKGMVGDLSYALIGGFGFEQLTQRIFTTRSQFQQLEVSFGTMLGDADKAKTLMNQLIDTAAKTPFDMMSITSGAKQLLAYGTAANEVNDILTRLGDISAGLSIPLGDLVYLYGTTMTQGRMYTQDLRQFMGRGIPMAEELAKQFGVSKSEVGDLVTKGKVGADNVKKAIEDMTSEGGKFGGLMEKQSHTLQGQWSNIGDTIDQQINEIGKDTEGIFNSALSFITTIIENWKKVAKVIGVAVAGLTAYKVGMMVAATVQKQQMLGGLRQNINESQKILNDSVGSGFFAWSKARKELRDEFAKMANTNVQSEEYDKIVRERGKELEDQGVLNKGLTDEIMQLREIARLREKQADDAKQEADAQKAHNDNLAKEQERQSKAHNASTGLMTDIDNANSAKERYDEADNAVKKQQAYTDRITANYGGQAQIDPIWSGEFDKLDELKKKRDELYSDWDKKSTAYYAKEKELIGNTYEQGSRGYYEQRMAIFNANHRDLQTEEQKLSVIEKETTTQRQRVADMRKSGNVPDEEQKRLEALNEQYNNQKDIVNQRKDAEVKAINDVVTARNAYNATVEEGNKIEADGFEKRMQQANTEQQRLSQRKDLAVAYYREQNTKGNVEARGNELNAASTAYQEQQAKVGAMGANIPQGYEQYDRAYQAELAKSEALKKKWEESKKAYLEAVEEEKKAQKSLNDLQAKVNNQPQVEQAKELLATAKSQYDQDKADYDVQVEKLNTIKQQVEEQQKKVDTPTVNDDGSINLYNEEDTNQLDSLKAQMSAQQSAVDEAAINMSESYQKMSSAQQEFNNACMEGVNTHQAEADAINDTVDSANNAADAMGNATASEESNTTSKQTNTATTQTNTASEDVNSTAKDKNGLASGNSAAKQSTETTAKNLGTAANGKQTVSEEVNTGAKEKNTLATRIASIAQDMWTGTVTSARAAWNAFTASLLANPFTAIITAITTVISLIMTFTGILDFFKGKEDDATEASNAFANSQKEAAAHVNTLFATLKTADASTQSYKESVSQLKDEYDKYGIKLDESIMKTGSEIDKKKELIKHEQELIGLIQEEAIARTKAENIQTNEKNYQDKIEEIKKDIQDAMGSAFSDQEKTMAMTLIPDSAITDLKNKLKAMNDAMAKSQKEFGNSYSSYSKPYIDAYNAAVNAMSSKMADYAKQLGKSEGAQRKAANAVKEHATEMANARLETDEANESQIRAANAANKAAMSNDKLSNSTRQSALEAKYARQQTDELYSSIQELIKNYNNNTIHFKITVDDQAVPDWMKKQLNINGKGGKQNVAHNRAAFWAGQLSDMQSRNVKGRYFNGVYYSQRDVAIRAAQYSNANKQIAKDTDTWKAGQKERDKAAKKAATAAKKAQTAADQEAARERQREDARVKAQEQYSKTLADFAKQAEEKAADNTVKAMQEGSTKEIAQIKNDTKKQLDELDDRYKKLGEARKNLAKTTYINSGTGKNKRTEADWKKTAEGQRSDEEWTRIALQEKDPNTGKTYQQYYDNERSSILDNQQKQLDKLNEDSVKSMTDYLKEYGSMQEQRLAISKEYDDKIAKAQTEGDRLTLNAQKDRALSDFDLKNQKSNMGWEDIFGNLGTFTKEQLGNIKERLKDMLSSDDLDVEGYKDVVEQIDKVNDAILEAEDKQKGFLGVAVSYNTERRKLEMDVADAEERQAAAMQEVSNAQANLTMQRYSMQQDLGGMGIKVDQKDISTANADGILKQVGDKYGTNSDEYKKVRDGLDKLAKSEGAYNEAVKKNKKATDDNTNAHRKLNQYLSSFSEKLKDIMPLLEQINANIQDIPGLLSTLGVSKDSSLGQAASSFADGTNSAMSAAKDYMSGNYVGAAMNGMKAIGSYTQSAISLFAGAGNEKKMEAEIAKLSEANKDLASAISSLKDSITDSNNTNQQSLEAYRKAIDAEKQREENQRKQIQDRAHEYSNRGHGFLGMGGRSSFRTYADRNRSAWLDDFNEALQLGGSTARVTNADSVFNLSPEDMKLLQEYSPKAWTAFFNSGGQANPKDLVEEYLQMSGQIKDLTDSLNEKLTGYSLEGFRDSYESLLEDLTKDTSDFGDNINDIINKAVIKSIVNSKKHQKEIQAIYDKIADAAKDDIITNEEADAIRQMNNDLAKELTDERKQLEDAGLITVDSYSQKASSGTYQTMSQETGEELSGRFTAVQEAAEGIWEQVRQINAKMVTTDTTGTPTLPTIASTDLSVLSVRFDTMNATSSQILGIADEGRTILSQGLLELQAINERQNGWERPLRIMFGQIKDMRDDIHNKL